MKPLMMFFVQKEHSRVNERLKSIKNILWNIYEKENKMDEGFSEFLWIAVELLAFLTFLADSLMVNGIAEWALTILKEFVDNKRTQ